MASTIDDTVATLATKALAAQAPETGGIWYKLIIAAVIALWAWYVKSELSAKDAALAKAQTALENAKMDAQLALLRSRSKVLTDAQNLDRQHALALLEVVANQKKDLDAQVADHTARVARVEALKTWSDLNALANGGK
jgi:transcription termination factor NusB